MTERYATDTYAVIGNPIAQSKSPLIHASFARATGQVMNYTRLLGTVGAFAADVNAFRQQGARGLNVTAPFKLDAFAYATALSADAQLAGAVNALKFEGSSVLGENFDGVGLVRDIQSNLGVALRAKRVLLLGAGGATRGALLPILRQLPASLTIANRDLGKAHSLVAQVDAALHAAPAAAASGQVQAQAPLKGVLLASSYSDVTGPFDVVINATSASLFGELPPIAASVFAPTCLAYDMVYGKGATPFLQLARTCGVHQCADGVGMLVEQAAEAFAWWRGVRPETASVIAAITVPIV
jgi:shikimate dehydrogenase